jgi:hypothetical protein
MQVGAEVASIMMVVILELLEPEATAEEVVALVPVQVLLEPQILVAVVEQVAG